MGIINKWIAKRAKEIISREEAIAEAKKQDWAKKQSDYATRKKLIYDVLSEKLQKIVDYRETEPCHIEVGDSAIINYFSLGRNGRNGWDGGPGSLLQNIPKEERTKPVTVKITKIYVDTSFAYEKIDRFLNEFSSESLCRLSPENVWAIYKNHLSKITTSLIWDKYGLYKTAHFQYEGTFQPKWGLNVNSFIKEGTPEYEKTFELWTREISINLRKESLRKEMNELEDEMKKIDEEHRNIKYC